MYSSTTEADGRAPTGIREAGHATSTISALIFLQSPLIIVEWLRLGLCCYSSKWCCLGTVWGLLKPEFRHRSETAACILHGLLTLWALITCIDFLWKIPFLETLGLSFQGRYKNPSWPWIPHLPQGDLDNLGDLWTCAFQIKGTKLFPSHWDKASDSSCHCPGCHGQRRLVRYYRNKIIQLPWDLQTCALLARCGHMWKGLPSTHWGPEGRKITSTFWPFLRMCSLSASAQLDGSPFLPLTLGVLVLIWWRTGWCCGTVPVASNISTVTTGS